MREIRWQNKSLKRLFMVEIKRNEIIGLKAGLRRDTGCFIAECFLVCNMYWINSISQATVLGSDFHRYSFSKLCSDPLNVLAFNKFPVLNIRLGGMAWKHYFTDSTRNECTLIYIYIYRAKCSFQVCRFKVLKSLKGFMVCFFFF